MSLQKKKVVDSERRMDIRSSSELAKLHRDITAR